MSIFQKSQKSHIGGFRDCHKTYLCAKLFYKTSFNFQSLSACSLREIRAAMIGGFCEHKFTIAGCTYNLFSFA
jgi:hypothetical protein